MKIGIKPYLRFWRPLPLLWILASLINPVVMACFVAARANSNVRFYGALVLLPLVFGMGQALIVARAIHQPAFVLLPGARRYFRAMYAVGALGLAAVATVIAELTVQTELPLPGIVGMVLIFLSLGLAWEPVHRWCGSIGLLVFVGALVIVTGVTTEVVREAVLKYPVGILGLGLVMLPAGIALAFDRERVRKRALTLLALFGGSFRALAKQGVARQERLGRSWAREPIGGRFSAWRRALWHERFGGITRTRFWTIMLSLMIGYVLVAFAALAVHLHGKHQPVTADAMAREFYALVWSSSTERHAIPLAPFVLGTASVVTFTLTLAFPVPAFLYPASRRTLMRLSLQVAFIRAVKVSVQGILVIVALAWLASHFAGQPFELRPTFLFALPLTVVPFLPLIAATGLSLVHRPGNPAYVMFSLPGLLWMAVSLASIVAAFLLSLFAREVLTVGGVAAVAVATLATSALLVGRARKLFLASDLIVRSAV
jgi:hypothetical protein